MTGWLDGSPEYHSKFRALLLKSGDYQARLSRSHYFLREHFRYPESDWPAQLIDLHFSDQHLDHLEAISGHAELTQWRLEPKLLTEWAMSGKTARVQVKVSELLRFLSVRSGGAILAIEDKRFFQHGAFDTMGIARAFWSGRAACAQLRSRAPSTISQCTARARSIFS